ncbi:MAG: flagellar basal body P-ring protein FlgI [Planctomycetota bacterium]
MRDRTSLRPLLAALGLAMALLAGCELPGKKPSNVFEVKRDLYERKLSGDAALARLGAGDKGTIGDVADMRGFEIIRLEGAGVVVGLPGTGDMSALPRELRAVALKRLVQAPDPYFKGDNSEHLSSKVATSWINRGYVSLVSIETVVTVGQHEGDRVDVLLHAMDGARGLDGGYLYPAPLRPYATMKGRKEEGAPVVEASGPIVVRQAQEGAGVVLKTGMVEGGGRVLRDFTEFVLPLRKPDAQRALFLEGCLNARFKDLETVAVASRSTHVRVKIPSAYWVDAMRFVEVVRLMPAYYADDSKKRSLAAEADRLLVSNDARRRMQGAIRLEGLGSPRGTDVLLAALQNGPPLTRIEAARSLFFLGREEGRGCARELLSSGTPELRLEALKLYLLFGSRAPIDEIRRVLSEKDPDLAAAAAFVLARCGDAGKDGRSPVVDVRRSPESSSPFGQTTPEEAGYQILAVPEAPVNAVVAVLGDERRAIVFLGTCPIAGNFSVPRQRIALSAGAPGRVDILFRAREEEGRFQAPADAASLIAFLEFLGLPWSENVSILQDLSRQQALSAPVRILSFTGSKTVTRLMGALIANR